MNTKTYPRTNDYQTIYLNTIINNPNIIVGDYTIYNDFVNDPAQFEKNNILYHYPINQDRLIIGSFTYKSSNIASPIVGFMPNSKVRELTF